MTDLHKRIEKILEQTFGGFVLDGGMRERKASKLITTLFKQELETLARAVEQMPKDKGITMNVGEWEAGYFSAKDDAVSLIRSKATRI